MNNIICLAIALVALLTEPAAGQTWKMQPLEIPTKWAPTVSPTNVLPEYPRHQLVRQNWRDLNGLWDYSITTTAAGQPSKYDGSILVPYPLESALSGVERRLRPDQ